MKKLFLITIFFSGFVANANFVCTVSGPSIPKRDFAGKEECDKFCSQYAAGAKCIWLSGDDPKYDIFKL